MSMISCPECGTEGNAPIVLARRLKRTICRVRHCPSCGFSWQTFEPIAEDESIRPSLPSPQPAVGSPPVSRWWVLEAEVGSEADNYLRMLVSKELRPNGLRSLNSEVYPSAAEALFQTANFYQVNSQLQGLLQAQFRAFFESLGVE